MKYSIVVPVYEESENLTELHRKIVAAMEKMQEPYEIIFVDDGSRDNSVEIAKTLSPLHCIVLRKNYGQTAALDAGIKTAKGEYIITLDGDLQNDPVDIPLLVEHLEKNNFDIVSGWRKNRKDGFMKRFVSRGANLLRRFLINDGIHDSGCTLKIYKRECFNGVDLYGEMHRFIPAILKIRGFRVGETEVHHYPRTHGKTKYGWKRTIKGFLDMLSVWFWQKFVSRPMHLLGGIGLCFWIIGFFSMSYVIAIKIMYDQDLSDNALTFVSLFLFFFGLNFLLLGILFDLNAKLYYSKSGDSPYLIREEIRNGEYKTP